MLGGGGGGRSKMGECRKFDPNIFNKTKCSNCYKLKELHSEAALEVNKATRHVTRCGYLFVAPDWDFTNPVYRTKRWQRRWFVLFDDGELTYSIDDHPETIPQATVNMGNVFEITEADAITGNEFSIAIVAPDGIHFIKGSCREESRLWLDILKLFSQCNTTTLRKDGATGRAKRSATFPGISRLAKVSTIKKQQEEAAAAAAAVVALHDGEQNLGGEEFEEEFDDEEESYEEEEEEEDFDEEETEEEDDEEGEEETSEEEEEEDPIPEPHTYRRRPFATAATMRKLSDKREETEAELEEEEETSEEEEKEDTMEPLAEEPKKATPEPVRRSYSGLSLLKQRTSDFYREDSRDSMFDFSPREKEEEPEIAPPPSSLASSEKQHDEDEAASRRSSLLSTTSTSSSPAQSSRGIPDGCGLLDLKEKKGWLMKETCANNWHKYWFVLKDGALMYYRDPTAELKGFLDGVIGLSTVESVREESLDKNFGFKLRTSEPRVHRFSAVTAGIRSKWMETIKGQMSTDGNFSSLDNNKNGGGSRSMGGGDSIHIRPIKRISSAGRFKLEDNPVIPPTRSLSTSVVAEATSTVVVVSPPTAPSPDVPTANPSLHDKLLSLHTQLDTQKDLLQEQKSDNFKLRRKMETLDQKLQEANVQTRLENEKVMELLQENSLLNRTAQEHKANADKWKDLYDSIYLQVGKCQNRISHLERLNDSCDDHLMAKDQIISDLSDQLQDSEERIQDLIGEIDVIKKNLEDNKNEYEDSLSRVIIAMDNQYTDKMESQRKHFAEESVKLSKLESELSLKNYVESYYPQFSPENAPPPPPPALASSSSAQTEPAHEIFADLYSRFQVTLKQTQALKQNLRESTALNDSLEVEKICLEQALKRTIKLNEDEERMLVSRVQDLTNKLMASEKNLRSAKERRASRSKRTSIVHQQAIVEQQAAASSASASVKEDIGNNKLM